MKSHAVEHRRAGGTGVEGGAFFDQAAHSRGISSEQASAVSFGDLVCQLLTNKVGWRGDGFEQPFPIELLSSLQRSPHEMRRESRGEKGAQSVEDEAAHAGGETREDESAEQLSTDEKVFKGEETVSVTDTNLLQRERSPRYDDPTNTPKVNPEPKISGEKLESEQGSSSNIGDSSAAERGNIQRVGNLAQPSVSPAEENAPRAPGTIQLEIHKDHEALNSGQSSRGEPKAVPDGVSPKRGRNEFELSAPSPKTTSVEPHTTGPANLPEGENNPVGIAVPLHRTFGKDTSPNVTTRGISEGEGRMGPNETSPQGKAPAEPGTPVLGHTSLIKPEFRSPAGEVLKSAQHHIAATTGGNLQPELPSIRGISAVGDGGGKAGPLPSGATEGVSLKPFEGGRPSSFQRLAPPLQTKIIERIQQIAEDLAVNRTPNSVVIRLEPAELGELTIKIFQRAEKLFTRITTETPEVEQFLIGKASEISQAIANSGIKLENIHVSVGQEQPEGDHDNYNLGEGFIGRQNDSGELKKESQMDGARAERFSEERESLSFDGTAVWRRARSGTQADGWVA